MGTTWFAITGKLHRHKLTTLMKRNHTLYCSLLAIQYAKTCLVWCYMSYTRVINYSNCGNEDSLVRERYHERVSRILPGIRFSPSPFPPLSVYLSICFTFSFSLCERYYSRFPSFSLVSFFLLPF